MNYSPHILKHFKAPSKFIALGEWNETLIGLQGWSGVVVGSPFHQDKVIQVEGRVTADDHFYVNGVGVWFRGLTLKMVLEKFAGEYKAVLINVPGLNRDIVFSVEMDALWPIVIVVKHDGRDQEIANCGAGRSYKVTRMERDAMVMAREDNP